MKHLRHNAKKRYFIACWLYVGSNSVCYCPRFSYSNNTENTFILSTEGTIRFPEETTPKPLLSFQRPRLRFYGRIRR